MKLKKLLKERQESGTLVSVDIQPSYEDDIDFSIRDYCQFLNESDFSEIHLLYNGYHTLGMDKEDEYIQWLFRNGLTEDTYRRSHFYDKGYAYFRYCMDQGFAGEQLVELVRWMWKNDIRDTRDIGEDEWPDHVGDDIVDLMRNNPDPLYIPDLMDYVNREISGSISLCGGGVNECLKEVEIVLLALNKTYNILHEWTY